MSSTSSNEYNKYNFELKLKLCDSEIKNIFGTTELAMLDCSDMTDEEINRIVDEWNGIPPLHIVPLIKEKLKTKSQEVFLMDKNAFVNEIIDTIREELNQSSISKYICNDGTIIYTDVGYIEDWFCVYADVLRKKYST